MPQLPQPERPNQQKLQQMLIKQQQLNMAHGAEQGGAFPLLSSRGEDLSQVMQGPDNIKKKAITELLVAQDIPKQLAAVILAASVKSTTAASGGGSARSAVASVTKLADKKRENYQIKGLKRKSKNIKDAPEAQLLKEINGAKKILNRLRSELNPATMNLADAYEKLDNYLQEMPEKLDPHYRQQLVMLTTAPEQKAHVQWGMKHNGVRLKSPEDLFKVLHQNELDFAYRSAPVPTRDVPAPKPQARQQELDKFIRTQTALIVCFTYNDEHQEAGRDAVQNSDFTPFMRLVSSKMLELREDLQGKTEVVEQLNKQMLQTSTKLSSLHQKRDQLVCMREPRIPDRAQQEDCSPFALPSIKPIPPAGGK